MSAPLSVYVHVPFCRRKCDYCDFASYPGRERDWAAYFRALAAEMAAWGPRAAGRPVPTVFFGGGTPSLVPPELLTEALFSIKGNFSLADNAEITLEANPGTLSPEKLRAYRRSGFNRLSLGAQSFDDGLLKALGRIHCAREIREAVAMAREAGFDNINLDLMYALPGQGMAQWEDTLREALALGSEHVSAYSLILEEGTPLYDRVKTPPEDETVNEMQRTATRMLAEAGLARYEISNYAKPGRACRHNLVYWRRGDYLGLGCAAHSLTGGERFHNPASLDEYLAGARALERAPLAPTDLLEEALMLGTRLAEGVDLSAIARRFGRDLRSKAERLQAGGLAALRDGRLALTERGMEVQDAVVLMLLEGITT